jgi:hypothetical protein
MMPLTILLGALLLISTSTPAASEPATPDVPPPELCHARPRTFEEMQPHEPPDEPTEASIPTPGPAPSPSPASPEVIGGITTKVREFVACLNAGEMLRVYGLYSDAGLYRFFLRHELVTREAYDELATPKPPAPEDRIKILDIPQVEVFPGGVRALVRLESAIDPRPRMLVLTFVDEDGRWMIEDVRGPLTIFLP